VARARHVLAIDQGTTSSRAIVFDRAGAPVAQSQRELEQHYPRAGWVEHNPDTIEATKTHGQSEDQTKTPVRRSRAPGGGRSGSLRRYSPVTEPSEAEGINRSYVRRVLRLGQ
jgi:FGGY family of carbohydrate kinases, N-terminal domain